MAELAGKKVLVVEDDALLHNLLADKFANLRSQGIEVTPCFTAGDALAKAKETKPDLILLDLVMPNMNGFEFLEALRKDEQLKDAAVFVLSNLSQQSDKDKAMALGVKAYLVKADYSLTEIAEKVLAFLAQGAS